MKEFDIALKSVIKAGEILKNKFGKTGYKLKGPANLVTQADFAAEKEIVSTIKKSFNKHNFLAEENNYGSIKSDNLWILDPLDGTINYAHNYPHCAVSLAYIKNSLINFGIIYNPFSNELFTAQKGRGAFLNDKKILVSKTSSLKNSLLATGFAYDRIKKADYYCNFYSSFMKISHDIRRAGAASLDMAWTACARLDGYWEFNLKPWDVAAGIIILEEAGGKISDFSGKNLTETNILSWGRETLCSNGKIHKEMLLKIKKLIKTENLKKYTKNS